MPISPQASPLTCEKDLIQNIVDIKTGKSKAHQDVQHPTIFHELLESDLPPEEKTLQRLGDEAQIVFGAGVETTAWILCAASFYILNSPSILAKLREELVNEIPDVKERLDWVRLEKLPYLTACIHEALRLGYGTTNRSPRISRGETRHGDWIIPAGVPVSMSTPHVHHNEKIFPNSHEFIPERWLDNPRTSNGSPLSRYLVSFDKGSRSCLGIK